MKKYIYIIIALLGFVSCNNEIESLPGDCNPILLRGIRADIDNGAGTRAVSPLVDSIGKYDFLNTDEIVFTKIERTKHPIRPGFSYDNVRYSCSIEGGNVSWKREHPTTDIFWSDGSEPHTFIGYILPHEDAKSASTSGYDWDDTNSAWKQNGFDWHYDETRCMYYGSIGNPTDKDEVIDYTATPATGAGATTPYDLEKLRKEDLLLTHSTEMQNEDAMAWVHFHHGLASIRVVVTITGFSATGTDPDAKTRVTQMLAHNMPTMYKWDKQGYRATAVEESDQTVLNGFQDWGGDAPLWNQKKEMKLWQSREYYGSGASRTFTFYGIVAPGMKDKVDMTFDVTYPNPLDPKGVELLHKPYSATLQLPDSKQVEFRPGYCTSININLNHKDEKMTVGAEYMSWQLDKSPDEGSLRKNSTHLTYTDRSKVTIVGDQQATPDDATWLYQATSGNIVDIYGNDGSAAKPYLIKTADQLLSFAYEVKNGRDFEHRFIKLDADITMQPSKDDQSITWIGIGDETHAFNGFFLGSGRFINSLYGEHFFYKIGDNAVIDKLNFADVKEVQGCGVIAHENNGLICGCYIDGDVKETIVSSQYTGSIVGTNNSFIIACAHVGKVEGRGTIGGLVGFNNGTVMACYHAGEVSSLDGSTDIHATVGKRGDGETIVDGKKTNNSIMFSCYYDDNLISHTPTLVPGKSGYPLSTAMMQSNAFVTSDFTFDYAGNKYSGQSKNLRQVVLEILGEGHDTKTDEQLLTELLGKGVTSPEVYQLFGYHFSLDEAVRVFTLWLNNIAAEAATKGEDYKVQTNCHDFTKLQILFLQQHYSNALHRFFYTPATYPKVQ